LWYCFPVIQTQHPPAVDTGDTSANRWVKPAGKDSLLLLTDRPPNLETPLKYFQLDYTPNNVFFVRWHLAGLPDSVNLETFQLTSSSPRTLKNSSITIKSLKLLFVIETLTHHTFKNITL
jgi:sulfite dehydrogenase